MLVQYETTIKKFAPLVLLGRPRLQSERQGGQVWKRKKGKTKTAARALSTFVALVGMGRGKGKHDLTMTAQNKRKMDNQENAQIWHARLGHISQDRIKMLVDSKSLKVDDLDHLPACESCLKGKMTKKPFVGQSKLASGLLDLIHLDVCGPLNAQARGGFSYFITFVDDHSRMVMFTS
ncbi:UNVERIFIED_CONTAM: hypothetical protein Scaly_1784100 [Sesamum calycinum]|uniref:GAG-pre-integrase domain-containing protein n=1 Tax=Sesamum calycinum TaxID=2727403 RepID=A0AAW2NZ61_9LAMI